MSETNSQLGEPPGQRSQRRWWPSLRVLLRTRIVAGLLTVIPLWVTWAILDFVFRMMKGFTEPIAWALASRIQSGQTNAVQVPVIEGEAEALIISRVLKDMMAQNMPEHVAGALPPAQQQQVIDRIADKLTYVLRDVPSAPVESQQYLQWIVPVVAVLLTLFFLYLLGLLGASVIGRRVIGLFEGFFTKLPVVKTIYRSVKQIVSSIGGIESQRLHRVVLVEVPRSGLKRIAFMTSVMTDSDSGRRLANVFIPYTPYLTTGYMQIVPLEEVSETNWTFEEAAKLIVSGGIISPLQVPYDTIHKVDFPASDGPAGAASAAV